MISVRIFSMHVISTKKTMKSAKDEVGFGDSGELTGAVGDVFKAFCGRDLPSLEAAEDAVLSAARDIFASSFGRFFVTTRHPATGASYHVTVAFLSDDFRNAVAESAYQSLRCVHNNIPINSRT